MTDKKFILGIDAGGTFTDTVLFDQNNQCVVAQSKVQTRHDDLPETIAEGIDKICLGKRKEDIESINIATTFATNAVVENRLRPSGLILIGYETGYIEHFLNEGGDFSTDKIIRVKGGHLVTGNEKEPLDVQSLLDQVEKILGDVDGIAVSAYFSVVNPEHELKALQLLKKRWPDLLITCGHELTSELNALKRASTAAINAGLVPIVMDLFRSIKQVCKERGITAPMSIIRGDGSLVNEAWAESHPIEMILSGPVASAVGARFLAGEGKLKGRSWIVDIGGTTTDIIPFDSDGNLSLNKKGACVGKYQTLIKTADIYTFGQGGDSRVSIGRQRKVLVGPKRCIPLCFSAERYPDIVNKIAAAEESEKEICPLFLLCGDNYAEENSEEREFQKYISENPALLSELNRDRKYGYFSDYRLNYLKERQYIELSGVTPTDAMHVLGIFKRWDTRASVEAAKKIANNMKMSPNEAADMILDEMAKNIAFCVFRKSYNSMPYRTELGAENERLLRTALDEEGNQGACLSFNLNAPLIGVGAPAHIIMPKVANYLHEECLIPLRAEVAGAIGAATGRFFLNYTIMITVTKDGKFRVHHPEGVSDFEELEDAVDFTHKMMEPWIRKQSLEMGAVEPMVSFTRKNIGLYTNGEIDDGHSLLRCEITVHAREKKALY